MRVHRLDEYLVLLVGRRLTPRPRAGWTLLRCGVLAVLSCCPACKRGDPEGDLVWKLAVGGDAAIVTRDVTATRRVRDIDTLGRRGEAIRWHAALPIDAAALLCHPKAVASLCRLDPAQTESRDGDGRTPLFYAAKSGCIEEIELLLQFGASAKARSSLGLTPLDEAAEDGWPLACRVLLGGGADPNELDSNDDTALVFAVMAESSSLPRVGGGIPPGMPTVPEADRLATVRELLRHHVNPNIRAKSGPTPLGVAVLAKDVALVNALLAGGADPLAAWMPGSESILSLAKLSGDLEIVDALRDRRSGEHPHSTARSKIVGRHGAGAP